MTNPIDGTASARQYMNAMQPGAEVTSPGSANQESRGRSVGSAPIQDPNEQAVRNGASVDGGADPTRTATEMDQVERGEYRMEDRRLGSRLDRFA